MPEHLDGSWQPVVIDVLRATSTMIAALAAGAVAVVPFRAPQEAVAAHAQDGKNSQGLLAGERGGLKIKGFDVGNSPLEMTAARVSGKRLFMSTTNGTCALLNAQSLGEPWVAALVNRRRVSAALIEAGRDVAVICAGQNNEFSGEDMVAAGAIVDGLGPAVLDDCARLALTWFRAHAANLDGLLGDCSHGRFLCEHGFADDVHWCARLDSFSLLPAFRDGAVRRG